MGFDVELAWRLLPALLQGASVSLGVLFPCLLFGMALSIPIALWRLSSNPLVGGFAWLFSLFFRGVPMLVLLYMIYNGFATVSLVRDTVLWEIFKEAYYCALIGFTLNHSGFLVELLRGAFLSIPVGVLEAAKSMGMSKFQVLFLIKLPIAARYALPAYMNEVTLFVKGTAVLGAITITDLLAVANSAVSTTYDPMTPMLMAGAIYWSMVQVVRIIFGHLETYLNRHLESVA